MLDILPTGFFLAAALLFLIHNDSRPVVQCYLLIVMSYLNIFPAIDFAISPSSTSGIFLQFQLYMILFFEIPLLLFLNRTENGSYRFALTAWEPREIRLSILLPFIFSLILLSFWFVSFRYNLFFVRLAYEGVQAEPAVIPSLLLYSYRSAVETSFFLIIFLFYTLRASQRTVKYRAFYKALLIGYLLTFLPFFAVNSRMQFAILMLILLCTQARPTVFSFRSVKPILIGLLAIFLMVGLTVIRELYIENNGRLSTSTYLETIQGVVSMVASRLNSLVMLEAIVETDFDPFGFQWSGLAHVANFYFSFFFDQQTFAAIKASEVTSPSVEIVNRLLSVSVVDFPKSMVLDVFLTFGVFGLPFLGIFLGVVVSAVHRQIRFASRFSTFFIVSIYSLPLLFQFEKEFIGFLTSFLKWSPILILAIILRPREKMICTKLNEDL